VLHHRSVTTLRLRIGRDCMFVTHLGLWTVSDGESTSVNAQPTALRDLPQFEIDMLIALLVSIPIPGVGRCGRHQFQVGLKSFMKEVELGGGLDIWKWGYQYVIYWDPAIFLTRIQECLSSPSQAPPCQNVGPLSLHPWYSCIEYIADYSQSNFCEKYGQSMCGSEVYGCCSIWLLNLWQMGWGCILVTFSNIHDFVESNLCIINDTERNVWLHNFTFAKTLLKCQQHCHPHPGVVDTPLTANHLTPCQASWMKLMSVSGWKGDSNNKQLAHIQPRHNLSNIQTHRAIGNSPPWLLPMVHNGHLWHVTGASDHAQWSSHQWARHLGAATGNHLNLKNGPPQRNVNLRTSPRRFVLTLGCRLSNATWSLRKAR